jgi:hypothetical protein
MTYMGESPGQRNSELIRQSSAAQQERLEAGADAREQARKARPNWLRRMLRRRTD